MILKGLNTKPQMNSKLDVGHCAAGVSPFQEARFLRELPCDHPGQRPPRVLTFHTIHPGWPRQLCGQREGQPCALRGFPQCPRRAGHGRLGSPR